MQNLSIIGILTVLGQGKSFYSPFFHSESVPAVAALIVPHSTPLPSFSPHHLIPRR